MKSFLVLLFVTALYITAGDCAKILCVVPFAGVSHTIVVKSICKKLAVRKHDVTAITHYPTKDPPPTYKEVLVPELLELMGQHASFNIFDLRKTKTHLLISYFHSMMMNASIDFLAHEKVQQYLHTEEKFDLLVAESFFMESVMGSFMNQLKIPTVAIQTSMTNLYMNNMVGNPSPDSYIPDGFLELDTRMTFSERLYNFLYSTYHRLLYHCWVIPSHDAIMRQHIGNEAAPLSTLLRNVSLVVLNHHHSLAFPRPYVPNMIEVGGMHVDKVKPLPKDLQEFMDNAPDGVIYFSLGSGIRSADMPKDRMQVFLDTFSKLKQKVLWKFEEKNLTDKPDNVYIHEWVPQTDILAHPNLKLFITHGGLGSTIETTYRGVPIIGIPIMADQVMNLMRAKRQGIGEVLEFDEITTDILYDTITKVVYDPSYKENVVKRSSILRDTPLPAMDYAMFWIEYVIRHKGAPHMRSAAVDLTWYQLHMLDVYAVIILIVYISYKLMKCLVKRLCRFGKSVSHAKKNN